MRALLDTHTLLWALADSRRLSRAARDLDEGVPMVSCDRDIARYPLQVIW